MEKELKLIKKLLLLLLVTTTVCASREENIYQSSKDKVVKIGMVLADGRHGVCSGAYIDSFGTVLTCAHCIEHEGITKLFVKNESGEYGLGVVSKVDVAHDLALIVTLPKKATPYFKFGKPVVPGQEVIAFGSPLGQQHTMSVGYVENLSHDIISYVIHSAFILPGNSGGPLVNIHGELVGVNEATVMLNFLVPAAGYYVAISISDVKGFLEAK